MGLTSLQVCMDSSDDWLQGTIHEENGMDSSSSPSGEPDMLTCSRPVNMMERRLRPQQEQALKCPRCDSTHTKFCYYNNYSLSQPRYFCKTCRRYWTKGGTLRNIPVGGGCRKNKKLSSKNTINNDQSSMNHTSPNPTLSSFADHHLHFPHHLNNLLPHHAHGGLANTTNSPNFMEPKYSNTADAMLENPTLPIDSTETKYDPFLGNSRNHGFMGIADLGIANFMSGFGDVSGSSHGSLMAPNFHGLCSPFDGIGNNFGIGSLMDSSCQRLMLPYDQGRSHEVQDHHQNAVVDVKPNTKLLSLEWQDRACSDAGKDSFGYLSGLGSWTGLMNGYGSSAANPLV